MEASSPSLSTTNTQSRRARRRVKERGRLQRQLARKLPLSPSPSFLSSAVGTNIVDIVIISEPIVRHRSLPLSPFSLLYSDNVTSDLIGTSQLVVNKMVVKSAVSLSKVVIDISKNSEPAVGLSHIVVDHQLVETAAALSPVVMNPVGGSAHLLQPSYTGDYPLSPSLLSPVAVEWSPGILQSHPPKPSPFIHLNGVMNLMERFQGEGSVTPGALRRALAKELKAKIQARNVSTETAPIFKPSALQFKELFCAEMLQPGDQPLPVGDSVLRFERIISLHRESSCFLCDSLPVTMLHPQCPAYRMAELLRCGIIPQLEEGPFIEQYAPTGGNGNHISADTYVDCTGEKIAALEAAGVCTKLAPGVQLPANGLCNPIGLIFRKSDLALAKAHGYPIKSPADLTKARKALGPQGLDICIIKERLIHDMTSSGYNSRCKKFPFRFASVIDVTDMITPGCTIGKCDVEAYFHQFPLALAARILVGFVFLSCYYVMNRLAMGMAPAPYIASVFTAFVLQVVQRRRPQSGIVAMMDDYVTAGQSQDVEDTLDTISNVHEDIGFKMVSKKREVGRQIVVYGILINTDNMTLSFDSKAAGAFRSEVDAQIKSMSYGHTASTTDLQHLGGKANHYSQVIQRGLSETQPFYDAQRAGSQLSSLQRATLLTALRYWRDTAAMWEAGGLVANQYPILSRARLRDEPERVVGICTDASGPDGIGGYWSDLRTKQHAFYCQQWDKEGQYSNFMADGTLKSSAWLELLALELTLQRALVGRSGCLVVWATDSLAAAYAALKGNSPSAGCRLTLQRIFDLLDLHHSFLLSTWIAREYNELSDSLSHLAVSLSLCSCSGILTGTSAASNVGGSSQGNSVGQGLSSELCEVRAVLHDAPDGGIPSDVRLNVQLPTDAGGGAERLHGIASQRRQQGEDGSGTSGLQVVVTGSPSTPQPIVGRAAQRRCSGSTPSCSVSGLTPEAGDCKTGPYRSSSAVHSMPSGGPQGAAHAGRRTRTQVMGLNGRSCDMGGDFDRMSSLTLGSGSHQDSSVGRLSASVCGGLSPSTLGLQVTQGLLRQIPLVDPALSSALSSHSPREARLDQGMHLRFASASSKDHSSQLRPRRSAVQRALASGWRGHRFVRGWPKLYTHQESG